MEERLQEYDQNEAVLYCAVYEILICSTYPILSLLLFLEVGTTCIATIDLYNGVDVNMYLNFLNCIHCMRFWHIVFKKNSVVLWTENTIC